MVFKLVCIGLVIDWCCIILGVVVFIGCVLFVLILFKLFNGWFNGLIIWLIKVFLMGIFMILFVCCILFFLWMVLKLLRIIIFILFVFKFCVILYELFENLISFLFMVFFKLWVWVILLLM